MLNCFFGAELKPDGVPVSFTIPKGTTLVITQCAVTSVVPPQQSTDAGASLFPAVAAKAYSPVTLCVQGHGLPTRFAVCSLSPAQHITYCPLQLLFSKPVSFVLVPQTGSTAAAAASSSPSPAAHAGKKAGRNQKCNKTAAGAHGAGAEATAAYPTVHLTGYYERAADEDEEDGSVAMDVMETSDDGEHDDLSDDE
ncbi:conserved hypothetical protein [Leishmania mexicana MHOM/GT/2001/U1103]|uniref:Nucleoplasmin-like domain-containing protein n=1 Tax=Leishmania mexicana (strain MHOM/GT/2001/U1103) TaxID=929439 RepID=E9AL73_LEIMU|nr:conserved hypothetical protein [Leishmania mexicana MHOM/GT/2001/U1103]CBZ23676.1 conserved hypothetical protein [Leishmania mexicana MHOM/GT/2001/U1103]